MVDQIAAGADGRAPVGALSAEWPRFGALGVVVVREGRGESRPFDLLRAGCCGGQSRDAGLPPFPRSA